MHSNAMKLILDFLKIFIYEISINADYIILFFAGGIISRTGFRACIGARSLLQMDKKVSPEAGRNID